MGRGALFSMWENDNPMRGNLEKNGTGGRLKHMVRRTRMGSLVAATLLLFSAIACSERLESKYATGAEALKVDAGHGWLPVFLPKDATQIQELHDLDSNDFWGTFDGSTITSPMTFCKDAAKLS